MKSGLMFAALGLSIASASAFAAESDVSSSVRYESVTATGERDGVTIARLELWELGSDVPFPVKACAKQSGFYCVRVWHPQIRDIEAFRMAVPRGALNSGMRWRYGDAVFSIIERHEAPPPVSSGGSFPTFDVAFAGHLVSAYLIGLQHKSKPGRIRSFLYSPELGVIAINVDCTRGTPVVCRPLLLVDRVGLFSLAFDSGVASKSAPESSPPVWLK